MLIGETFYYAEEAYLSLYIMKNTGLPCLVTISTMAENTIRGAAGYSVLLVEQLLADGLLYDNNTILAREI